MHIDRGKGCLDAVDPRDHRLEGHRIAAGAYGGMGHVKGKPGQLGLRLLQSFGNVGPVPAQPGASDPLPTQEDVDAGHGADPAVGPSVHPEARPVDRAARRGNIDGPADGMHSSGGSQRDGR
jgi:hypothetical protein